MDLRQKPRIEFPFPVLVRGTDADGEPFEIETVLGNLSASGFYARLRRRIQKDSRLCSLIELAHAVQPDRGSEPRPVPRLATRGVVVRSEIVGDAECGVAVRFTRHRFF